MEIKNSTTERREAIIAAHKRPKTCAEKPGKPMEEKAYCRGCNRTFDIHDKLGEHYTEIFPDGSKQWHPVVDCNAGVLH